ncbi:hypothetical protein EE612_013287, partial [Oryza sativa]
LCTVTQVEEVKCILKMLPIWLCTIVYSVVFTQMASLFVACRCSTSSACWRSSPSTGACSCRSCRACPATRRG